MKNVKLFMLASSIILTLSTVNAQKYTEGDKSLSFLAGETAVNLEYNYDDMLVGKKPEAQYIKEKVEEYNKKQPGKGERWKEKWINNRAAIYEPMFEELINKIMFKANLKINIDKKQSAAKYTLVVRTTMTEPGFNAVVVKVNPSCNFEFTWIETATKKVMAKGKLDKVQGVVMNGSDWDFDPANKIKECYAKAGKVVGKTMEKALVAKKKKK